MAYKVLYRKYRPQDFNDLYGQDNIKKLLLESIKQNKLSHAYLFSGPRGTGKTSTAKLFAKAINCENCNDGIPCNECIPCKNYDESPDIIEIDAASNNDVDEIRNLRENAKILPTFSKYKIYIIDEVHMLSTSAWNAFLKTLEEPPKHVIFILATTELQKIPITIVSRCQRFNFKKISAEIICENLIKIAKLESIKLNEEAAKYISDLSDGGMRDALSILDQLSKENEEITPEIIHSSFGLVSNEIIDKLFASLQNENICEFNSIFKDFESLGIDNTSFINIIISYLFNLEETLVSEKNDYFLSINQIKFLAKEISECYLKKDSLNLIKIILLSYFPVEKSLGNISQEIKLDDQKIESNMQEIEEKPLKPVSNLEDIETLITIRVNNSFYNANKKAKEKFIKIWQDFIESERLKNNNEVLSLIEDSVVEVVSETNAILSNSSLSTTMLFCQSINEIEQELKKCLSVDIKLICLDSNRCLFEKKNYIKNSKITEYAYIKEEEENNKHKKIKSVDSANDLFDKNLIEIK